MDEAEEDVDGGDLSTNESFSIGSGSERSTAASSQGGTRIGGSAKSRSESKLLQLSKPKLDESMDE
jgi:hypothetical protein